MLKWFARNLGIISSYFVGTLPNEIHLHVNTKWFSHFTKSFSSGDCSIFPTSLCSDTDTPCSDTPMFRHHYIYSNDPNTPMFQHPYVPTTCTNILCQPFYKKLHLTAIQSINVPVTYVVPQRSLICMKRVFPL